MSRRRNPNGPTLREQQKAARRAQILEAALTLFAQKGYDATSTREIANQVGVTEGLIFHYFPTKADLLRAGLETSHSFLSELRNLLTRVEQRPAREVLTELAEGWLATLRRESALSAVLFSTAQTNPEAALVLGQLMQEGTGRLAQYLAARVQAGELRPDLPLPSSAQMICSSLIVFWLAHRALPDEQWEPLAAGHVNGLLTVWLEGARR